MKIELEINNIENAKNNFNSNTISDSLNQYLISNFEYKSLRNNKISLQIKGIQNKNEQIFLTDLIHNYYQEQEKLYSKIDTIDNYFRLIFSIVGIIAIIISQKFTTFLSELFLITGWFIIWEIIDDILFKENERKRKKKIYKSLANAKINFIN